jgi:hypothetical protein
MHQLHLLWASNVKFQNSSSEGVETYTHPPHCVIIYFLKGKERSICLRESFNPLNNYVVYVTASLDIWVNKTVFCLHTQNIGSFVMILRTNMVYAPQNHLLNILCQWDADCLVWSRGGLKISLRWTPGILQWGTICVSKKEYVKKI